MHTFAYVLAAFVGIAVDLSAGVIYSERGHAVELRCHSNRALMIAVIFKNEALINEIHMR